MSGAACGGTGFSWRRVTVCLMAWVVLGFAIWMGLDKDLLEKFILGVIGMSSAYVLGDTWQKGKNAEKLKG